MKKILLLITISLLYIPAFAQKISGEYQRIDNVPGTEESTFINFEKNYSFEEVSKKHLESSTIRKGNFKFKGDTLILNFQESKEKDFVITKKDRIEQNDSLDKLQTNLFLNVHYKNGKQNSDAIIHFNDKNGEIFIATTIKSNNAFSLFNDKIESLKLSSLGMNDIEVNLKPILGYNSTIDIYFSNVKFENANPETQKFLIEKLTNGNLKLTSLNKKDVWILEKV